jgi:hypothetical protein
MWKGGYDSYGEPLLSADIASKYRNERGLVFPLYEYSKDRESGPNRPAQTRFSAAVMAARFLTANIDMDDLSRTSAKASRIVQSQIRAFVAVDEELEKASGKKYAWGAGGAHDPLVEQAIRKGVKQ